MIVAHDLGDADRRPDALILETLEHVLAEPPLSSMPVLLDVKSLGAARALAAALVGARLTRARSSRRPIRRCCAASR